MLYAQARAFMRSGDLILFRGHGLYAWIIRAWTQSDFAHAAVIWRVGDRVMLLESRARTHGVAMGRALSDALPDGATWFRTGAKWSPDAEVMAFDRGLGQPYGWWDALRAAFNMRPTSRGLQCAEYAVDVLVAAGVAIRVEAPTPRALAEALRDGVRLSL